MGLNVSDGHGSNIKGPPRSRQCRESSKNQESNCIVHADNECTFLVMVFNIAFTKLKATDLGVCRGSFR